MMIHQITKLAYPLWAHCLYNNKKHPNQFKCQQQLSPSLVYFMTPDQCEGRLTAPVPYNVTLGSVQV